jgi:hypothetical protein
MCFHRSEPYIIGYVRNGNAEDSELITLKPPILGYVINGIDVFAPGYIVNAQRNGAVGKRREVMTGFDIHRNV